MRAFALVLLLIGLLLSACAQMPSPTASPTPPPTLPPTDTATPAPTFTPAPTATPVGEAVVRFVHAAPGIEAVTIYAGDKAVAANLEFGGPTFPTPLPAGRYNLRVLPAGSRSSATPLLEQTLTFERDTSLLVVLTNNGGVQFVTFPVIIPPLSAGEIGLTLVNLLSDMSDVSLFQQDTVIGAAPPMGVSEALHLPAPDEDLELRDSAGTVFTLDRIWTEGVHHTLILAGSRTQPTILTLDERAPGLTSLRVVNAGSLAPAVEVYLDDQLIAANVEYIRPADRVDAISGTYTARVFTAGANPASDQPLVSQTITLDNTPYSMLLVLGSAENPVAAAYPEDLSPTPPDEARLTFINTLEGLPTLELQGSEGQSLIVRYAHTPVTMVDSAASYNFYWVGSDATGQQDTAEIAENVQLEAGYSYLYFITGRTDNNPVILSDRVGTTEDSAVSDDGSVSTSGALLRLVNAVEDQTPVEFTANGEVLATVSYGEGTAFIPLLQRGADVSVRINGSDVAAGGTTFEAGKRYTIVAYGSTSDSVQLLIITDEALIFGGDAPHLRLINASLNPEVRLGLAYSDAAPAIENAPEGTEAPDVDAFRRSIPAGTFSLVNDIPTRADSGVILLPPGNVNLDVLDSTRAEIAVSLAFVELQAGTHYDVIAYQAAASPRVQAFILPYPLSSD